MTQLQHKTIRPPKIFNAHGGLGPKLLAVGGGVVIIFIIICLVWGVGVSNSEKKIVNRMDAQSATIEAFFDKMWKILQQQAGVTNEYKESFHKIYKDLMAGRYSGEGKGEMMLWVKESNPQFETKLFEKLMVSIEAQREGFFVEQKKILDMIREQKDMIDLFPSSIIVGNRPIFKYEVISSAKTKKVMETREENDVDLFKKKE